MRVFLRWQRGGVTSYPDETFRPTRDITRGELAVVMGRTLKLHFWVLDT